MQINIADATTTIVIVYPNLAAAFLSGFFIFHVPL